MMQSSQNRQNGHGRNGHSNNRSELGAGGPAAKPQDPFAFGKPLDLEQLVNLLFIIRERWLWGLSAGLLVAGLFAFVSLRKEPVYEAEALLLIESKAAQIIDVEEVVDTSLSGRNESELDNHLRQLQSRNFRQSVIATFTDQEQKTLLRAYLPDDPDAPAPSLAGLLANSVTINRDGQVFTVTSRHRNPMSAALISNRYAAQYIREILTRTGVGNESALAFLQQQAQELRNKISEAEKQLTNYRTRYSLVSLEDNQNIIVERLKAINTRLTSAKMDQVQQETRVAQVAALIENWDPDAATDTTSVRHAQILTEIPAIAEYGMVETLLAQQKALLGEQAELELRYLERHPKMVEMTKRLGEAQRQLDREVQRAIANLTNRKNATDREITRLEQELAHAEAEALSLDQLAVEYNVLKRQLDSDRQTFDSIINRLNETNLSAKLDTTNLRILDEAVPPYQPVEPNPRKIALASGFLLLLGIGGLPLLVEALDNRLKSAYDVESFINKPLLADLPHIKELDTGSLPNTVVLNEANDMLLEGFRSAYSAIQLHSSVGSPKVMTVTSTHPSEGKSFVASNLAACMAQHGLRTLLVDTDLRRPTLHRHFSLRNDKGILQWFEKQRDTDAAPHNNIMEDPHLDIQRITDNLHFIRAGGSTKKTTELIDSKAFEGLMTHLRTQFDVILMDTPPVSLFPDPLFLADLADEVIYVARYNKVSRQKARHFIQKLDGPHKKVTGVVINGRTSAKGQRYGYDYAYSYYSSDYKYYKRYMDGSEAAPKKRVRSRHSKSSTQPASET